MQPSSERGFFGGLGHGRQHLTVYEQGDSSFQILEKRNFP
jgi:hypothetical protein